MNSESTYYVPDPCAKFSHLHKSPLGPRYPHDLPRAHLAEKTRAGIQTLVHLFPKSKLIPPNPCFRRWVLAPLSAPLPAGDHQLVGTGASSLNGSLHRQARRFWLHRLPRRLSQFYYAIRTLCFSIVAHLVTGVSQFCTGLIYPAPRRVYSIPGLKMSGASQLLRKHKPWHLWSRGLGRGYHAQTRPVCYVNNRGR